MNVSFRNRKPIKTISDLFLKGKAVKNIANLVEKSVFGLSIALFFLHLLLIQSSKSGLISNDFLKSQSLLDAITTPFNIILIYEVILLVLSFRYSSAKFIEKQIEVTALIIIRDIFKQIVTVINSPASISNFIVFELVLQILLVICIYYLVLELKKRISESSMNIETVINKLRKILSYLLFLLTIFLLVQSLLDFSSTTNYPLELLYRYDIQLFLKGLYTYLILADFIVLALTFTYKHEFRTIFFETLVIISALILRLVFIVEPITATVLINISIIVSLAGQAVYMRFKTNER